MFRLIVLATLATCTLSTTLTELMKPALDGRIVGGKDTTIEEFPYQVSLRYFGSHFCGGSIYNSKIIITAAHCVDGESASRITVVAGTTYQLSGGVERRVKKIVSHPNFSEETYDYDIAILLLERALSFSASIQPAEDSYELRSGRTAFVSGWGVLQRKGSSPNILQFVAVTTVGFSECYESYRNYPINVTPRMVCAGENTGGLDACQGDSGGPFVIGSQLVGAVSWGEGCALAKYPGVYASIAEPRGWLDQNIAAVL